MKDLIYIMWEEGIIMKCPNLKRKVSGIHFYGISCKSQYEAVGHNHGLYDGWQKDYRDEYYCKYCIGDYKSCLFYKRN